MRKYIVTILGLVVIIFFISMLAVERRLDAEKRKWVSNPRPVFEAGIVTAKTNDFISIKTAGVRAATTNIVIKVRTPTDYWVGKDVTLQWLWVHPRNNPKAYAQNAI